MMEAIRAIKQDTQALRSLALRAYLDAPFSRKESNMFLRRLREAEKMQQIAILIVIGVEIQAL